MRTSTGRIHQFAEGSELISELQGFSIGKGRTLYSSEGSGKSLVSTI